MLSLGSNISATQVVESKYSANFDGTNDYIDTGQTFQSVFRGDYSISFWMKPDDGQVGNGLPAAAAGCSSSSVHFTATPSRTMAAVVVRVWAAV